MGLLRSGAASFARARVQQDTRHLLVPTVATTRTPDRTLIVLMTAPDQHS